MIETFWFVHHTVQRGRRSPQVVWALGDERGFVFARVTQSHRLYDVARKLIDQPGVPVPAHRLGYTSGPKAIAQWRRRVLHALREPPPVGLGLADLAAALDRCLDVEGGTVTFRPRGVRFLTWGNIRVLDECHIPRRRRS